MRKTLSFIALAMMLLLVGCSKEYDDSALMGRVDNLENRVLKLEQLCNQMNTNISSLQTIVTALQKNDYVTGVTPVTEDGVTIGYTITFAKAEAITIYHGKNGVDGKDGADGYTPVIGVKQDSDGIYYWILDGEWLTDEKGNKIKAVGADGKDGIDGTNGKDGVDGKDGADGYTPVIGVKQDSDGIYYWTLDGEWLTDEKGNKIKAVGADGKDGIDGENGKDGTNGKDGVDGDAFFREVTEDEENVYFTLADGTIITLPKAQPLSIAFNDADLVVMSPNSTRSIGYTVTTSVETATVEVVSSADIKAKVVADDESGLTGKIEIKTGATIDEYSKLIVLVSDGYKVIMRSITFEEAGLQVEEDAAQKSATAEGGEMTLEFLSNVACEVVIPEDAQSWISVVPATRAMEKQTITLLLEPNTGYYRSATITVQSPDGTLKLEYQVEQVGDMGVEIDPTAIPDNEIWYVMTDGTVYDVYQTTEQYGHQPFDAKVISNTYENGYGIIKFDAPVTKINDHTFGNFWAANMSELYLPDCVEYLGTGAIHHTGLSTLRIPKNLKKVDSYGLNNPNLQSFSGEYVSEDGKCVIIDGFLCGFAPKGITEYSIPEGVKIIDSYAFSWCEIEEVSFPEGLEYIGGDAFCECKNLKSVTLPSSLQELHSYAFRGCTSIEGFYGNEKFHTPDHKCLIFEMNSPYVPASWNGTWICGFAGHGLSEYTIPEGIVGIENYTFESKTDLQSVTLPSTIVEVAAHAFEGCSNLEAIYGEHTSEDHRCVVFDGQLRTLAARKGVSSTYKIPDNITSIGYGAFVGCSEIKTITMCDQVTEIEGYAFAWCPNLQSITLSASLKDLSGYNAFLHSDKLETIYCRALVPPSFMDKQMSEFPNLKFYVPEQSLALYQRNAGWSLFKKYFVGYKYDDIIDSNYYISSDFSKDGTVFTLQKASKGNGIDFVLMGDAYSDRQITDGTYKTDMELLHNNLFTEEPYKSFKDYFNVYYVNIVSATEGYEHAGAALGGFFGDGTYVGGNDNAAFDYALKAISEERMDEALLIVAMNSDNYAGTCYMYYPGNSGDYGSGPSVAYFPKGGDAVTFAQLLHHEACGHGFAKLADEYAYEDMGTISMGEVTITKEQQNNWGWWKNVDFTDNLNTIRWSKFINDTRYANDGLGAYEGGLTYWTGVWRPTENSIMRYNTGGFNAPSREAIYYRIHKLAYGDSWEYDYEDFVEYDAVNRKAAASARTKSYKPSNYKPTHPPVIMNKSWKDAE